MATNATHAGGYVELDTHNLWGMMEEKATHLALLSIHPNKRPFLISRSTFPSTGRWSGHWLGDNSSKWAYLIASIQGVLQFQIFQIPMVGADTCGFIGNTDEELCNRWMQLSAFMPFYRNHNQRGAMSQEPYRWDSVANASRTAIGIRYSLLPYWVRFSHTCYATDKSNSFTVYSVRQCLAIRFSADSGPLLRVSGRTRAVRRRQAIFGRARPLDYTGSDSKRFYSGWCVSSILSVYRRVCFTTSESYVGIFPGRGRAIWRDWYTHKVVNATSGGPTTLDAPLGHINVHIRDGSAILLHERPAYTIAETRQSPYALLVSLAAEGYAFGDAYIDDGESVPPTPSRTVQFHARSGSITITGHGSFDVEQKLGTITLLGARKPQNVIVDGRVVHSWRYTDATQELVISDLSIDLNDTIDVVWH